ncbi:MAG: cofactor assembly of complex C subunit B [Oscillatoriaceae bacterium SKW80]|nr:cofactor assembly of complex C subunit B [Oscillatoriaceae bacterium SKYG93]MCX8122432.1 cofactor assembly of complex C subunit B [Oscillatoriaceae bacterium SKW80]MDW8452643.1 cofactor assembly of complex C subunit B [Oscillatoriaceae cyanobacterium SKYGB_i_bin93]HIK28031.1 cofactor assembly of complex C subunit B [Oscillatoriaceae cyanobacterium M7585_C2015_266]
MSELTLSSTFLLTLLLAVGLFFFIRASVKDRTEEVKLISPQPEDSLVAQLQQYFSQRAYRVVSADESQKQVTFEGYVQPSLFLAFFLTLLAAIGIFCLALVLAILFPQWGNLFFFLLVFAPTAGIFYWKGAGRLEKVFLKLESLNDESGILIIVKAHRDELAELQRALSLIPRE